MGSDKQENATRRSAKSKGKGDRSGIGCFVGLSPDKFVKERIAKRAQDLDWMETVLVHAFDDGLRLAGRYDERNEAYVLTCTRVGETFADNQTVAAYHASPTKALAILLDALDNEFLAQEDWRYRQGKFDLDW